MKSRWCIPKGITGKHGGLSYCENCDFVPPYTAVFNDWLEYQRGPQMLSPYCPNCGAAMVNGGWKFDGAR